MKRAAFIAIGLTLAAALAPGTAAYNFDGPRWAVTQVPFFVNPVNSDVSEDAAITALQMAAAAWSEQTNANVSLYYAGRTTGGSLANNGINEVFFRNETNGTQGAAAYYWYNGSGNLVDADMVIWDAAYRFYTGQSGCGGSGIYLEDIATHEFGHFLGLNHSADTAATMYPTMPAYCTQSWRALSSDDIAGIEALYPAAATAAALPPPAAPVNVGPANGATGLGTSLTLTWQAAAGAASYDVFLGTTGNPASFRAGLTGTSLAVNKLLAGTTYYWRVVARNSAGEVSGATWSFGTAVKVGKPGNRR